MPSRRDLLKAIGGLVLATGGSWLASHAHGGNDVAGSSESQDAVARPGKIDSADKPQGAKDSAAQRRL